MPLPNPRATDSKESWIERCMSDQAMKNEFPNNNQRLAVCNTKWDDRPVANRVSNCFKQNLATGDYRFEQLDGKQHLVIPTVMMVEGVHAGSAGPMLYLLEEFGKDPQFWNGMPVPIYHPNGDEGPVSCNTPESIEQYTAGRLFNTKIEDNKLKSEIWLDVEKANRLNPKLISLVLSGVNMDVSTGHYSFDDMTPGTYNGVDYIGVIRDIHPDHLAILPGVEGACNWEDGCGIRVNQNGKGGEETDMVKKLRTDAEVKQTAADIVGNLEDEGKRSWVSNKLASLARWIGLSVNENEVSHGQVRGELQRFVDTLDTPSQQTPSLIHFVVAVFDDFFIYEAVKEGEPRVLLKQDYNVDDAGKVEPIGLPMAVREETNFVAASTTKTKSNRKETRTMERKEAVTALIANEGSVFKEEDRELLTNMDDAAFERMQAIPVQKEVPVVNDNAAAGTGEADNAAAAAAATVGDALPTVDSFLQDAPESIREVLNEGMVLVKNKKTKLVQKVLAAEGNVYTEDELKAMDVTTLEKMGSLIPVPSSAADFSGQGGGAGGDGTPKRNEKQEGGLGIPDMPTVNWG